MIAQTSGLADLLSGAAVSARSGAAGSGTQLSGDFCDVLALDGERWLLIVGDVRGKGPAAAEVATAARMLLRAAAPAAPGPAALLAGLNERLLRATDPEFGRFVTVAAASLAREGDGFRAKIAAAGHPDPLLLRLTGVVERFGASGPPCGIDTAARYTDADAILAPGDALVLFTDGVLEAGAPERQLAVADVAEVLAGHANGSADELADALAGLVALHGGGDPRDDFAVLALRADRTGA